MAFAVAPPKTGQDDSTPLFPKHNMTAFLLVTGLFFLWGIANNLNDILIRQFMKSFEISRLQAGLVQFGLLHRLFLFLDSGRPGHAPLRIQDRPGDRTAPLRRRNVSVLAGRPVVGSYWLFLIALFVIASGLGFLETGSNPLIAQMGEPESAVRRLNFSQAFNPFGSIAGVLIGTVFIFSGVELTTRRVAAEEAGGNLRRLSAHETLRVVAPYIVLGAVVLFWAFLIWRTPFPAVAVSRSSDSDEPQGSFRDLLRYPHLPARRRWRSAAMWARRSARGATSSSTCRTTPTCRKRPRATS